MRDINAAKKILLEELRQIAIRKINIGQGLLPELMLAEIVGYEVIVMHKIKFAKEAADTVIFMDNGRIMEKGSKHQIFEAPENERTKRFIQQALKT